jgi:hypothetical protein
VHGCDARPDEGGRHEQDASLVEPPRTPAEQPVAVERKRRRDAVEHRRQSLTRERARLVEDVALEQPLDVRPRRPDQPCPDRREQPGDPVRGAVREQRALGGGPALVQVAIDLGADMQRRRFANALELGVDPAHGAARCRAQEVGHRAVGPGQYEQRAKVVRGGEPLQRRAMAAQPGAVNGSRGRVGDRARDLDDLADGRDGEPATEQVGN